MTRCTPTCISPSPSQAHCGSGCHRTFGSVSGFDRHRRAGQCLDPATFTGHAAMHVDRNGIWRYDGGHRRADAHSRSHCEPQAAETPSGVSQPRVDGSKPAETISAPCEPPGDLCCHWCTEVVHPNHLHSGQCVLEPERKADQA